MGTNLSPALLGVGYIVGLEHRHRRAVRQHPVVAHRDSDLPRVLPRQRSGARGAASPAPSAADAAGAIWSTKIRYLGVGAMLIGGVWTLFSLRKSLLSGITQRLRRRAQGHRRTVVAETERDLPMKWMLIALVLFVLPLALLYQAIVGQWCVSIPMTIIMIVAGLPVRVGVGVSRRPGRFVEQSGVRHHHRDDPVRVARAGAAARSRFADRRGRRDHDRRGGVLRGGGRRRQPAGPQGRLPRRRDAVEAAADAGDRRVLVRADHGAGAEPARRRLRHRRADAGASAIRSPHRRRR